MVKTKMRCVNLCEPDFKCGRIPPWLGGNLALQIKTQISGFFPRDFNPNRFPLEPAQCQGVLLLLCGIEY